MNSIPILSKLAAALSLHRVDVNSYKPKYYTVAQLSEPRKNPNPDSAVRMAMTATQKQSDAQAQNTRRHKI